MLCAAVTSPGPHTHLTSASGYPEKGNGTEWARKIRLHGSIAAMVHPSFMKMREKSIAVKKNIIYIRKKLKRMNLRMFLRMPFYEMHPNLENLSLEKNKKKKNRHASIHSKQSQILHKENEVLT